MSLAPPDGMEVAHLLAGLGILATHGLVCPDRTPHGTNDAERSTRQPNPTRGAPSDSPVARAEEALRCGHQRDSDNGDVPPVLSSVWV